MSKLYKILVMQIAPKNSTTAIDSFLIADSLDEVYRWVDKNRNYGDWLDHEEDNPDEKIEIYDDEFNVTGSETFKQNIIRNNGGIADADWSDAYYGPTFYGWEEVVDFPMAYVGAFSAANILNYSNTDD